MKLKSSRIEKNAKNPRYVYNGGVTKFVESLAIDFLRTMDLSQIYILLFRGNYNSNDYPRKFPDL